MFHYTNNVHMCCLQCVLKHKFMIKFKILKLYNSILGSVKTYFIVKPKGFFHEIFIYCLFV